MNNIKLIACDMDGTLLDQDKKIPPQNIDAVRMLKEAGIYFVIATGRHDSMIKPYLDDLEIEMPVISCNGAIVREPFHDKLFSSTPLSRKQMLTMIEICRDAGVDYHIYAHETVFGETLTNKMIYYTERNKILPAREQVRLLVSEDYKSFIEGTEEELYKMLVITKDNRLLKEVDESIFRATGLKSAQSDFDLFDIMQKDVNKANALEALASKLGIKREETAAIGDQINDMEMIEWAGIGIAMANAIPAVKNAAQMVTARANGEGGVAESIKKLLNR